MYNPESVKQSYAIVWGKEQGVGQSSAELVYSRSLPNELNLDLILDGTGVDQPEDLSDVLQKPKPVLDQVKEFLNVVFQYQGELHQPNYLLVSWGGIDSFKCRFLSVDITYTLFDRQGVPLRATLKAVLISDENAEERARKENKQSPDLTHERVVRSGDTLPLLSKQIYGSSAHYLHVARYNGLDNFRSLVPGQTLLFPPLATFASGSGKA